MRYGSVGRRGFHTRESRLSTPRPAAPLPASRWVLAAILGALLALAGCTEPGAEGQDDGGVADAEGDGAGGGDASGDATLDAPLDGDADVDDGSCVPGSRVCVTSTTYLECQDDGFTRSTVQCEGGLGCLDGACVERVCEPFEIRGCAGEFTLETCNFSGTDWVPEECPAFWRCDEGRCLEPPCLPGATRCDGLDRILTCDPATGEYVETEQCGEGAACYQDECQPLCEINRKVHSYVGCEYWSVDLDNYSDAEFMEHTVVLSNPNVNFDAQVEVRDADDQLLALDDATVPAGGQLVIRFPNDRGLTRPGVTNFSWRLTSTVPVTAHQFNPLDNFTDPFTNDGTLLLPTHALGESYYAASWVHRAASSDSLNGFVVILAVDIGPTTVSVTVPSRALTGEDGNPMAPGDTRTWSLAQGEVLTLQTAGVGDDLTGTRIEADGGRVAVWGGHECGNVTLGVDRCDHMEAQIMPVELLSEEYVAIKYATRVEEGTRSEPDVWRVLAVEGATTITTDPEIPGVSGTLVQRGEWIEIESRNDFIIRGDRPILVAHYMVGSNWTGIPRECFDSTGPPTGIGDPAMTQLVPIDQYRADYTVLTPFAYVRDYLNVAVPQRAIETVMLDGEPVDSALFEQIGDTDWWAARILVEDGPHKVTAAEPFALDAYGYSCHVSYAYPGGMSLEGIGEDREQSRRNRSEREDDDDRDDDEREERR